ncbi:MAG: DUF2807 domain-containing protein [Bacteroidota bacterium]
MKTYILSIVFGFVLLGIGCDSTETEELLPRDFTVDAYSKVSVDGQVQVIFNKGNQLAKTTDSGFRVVIKSSDEQLKSITVKSENGELSISAGNNIVLEDDVIIELTTSELDEIKLESDQKAVFVGTFDQEELSVVTEASSELSLLGVKINRLYSVQQGESSFNLSTWSEMIDGEPSYAEDRGILLNDTTLLVDNSIIVVGDSIKLGDTEPIEWIVYGEDVREYFQIDYCDFKTEGNTTINADTAPIKEINIKLEGTSQARIWAIDKITGKGEGSSILYYLGDPDYSGFVTQGGAQIISIN